MGKETETNAIHAPIRQSVHVDCAREDAFRLFTEGFGEWWSMAFSSAGGTDSEFCEVEPWVGGKIFERTRSGDEHDLGTVTVWDPPARVAFTWHPAEREGNQTVTVDFQTEADGTRVTLTHRNWSLTGVAVCASDFARFVSEQMAAA
jgi:uncharacterized protein YndB with AHSA1/START domain